MAKALAVLCCAGVLLSAYLAFEVGVFRFACRLCRVPAPGAGRTVGLVLLLLFVPTVIDAVSAGILAEVYLAAGYPLWEAGVVEFLLALPVHMGICSLMHSKLLALPWGECLGVWFVEKLIKLGMLLAALGVVALFALAR